MIDDGFLESLTAECCHELDFLAPLPKVFSGRHLDGPCVRMRRARKV